MSNKTKKGKVDEGKDIFVVERVLARRIGKAGREEFLIQWQGFPESDSSWEPRENLQCTEMLELFENESVKKPPTRRRPKSPDSAEVAPADQTASTAEIEAHTSQDKYELNGKQMKCVVGITRQTGELHFLCKFADDTAMLLPAKEVNSRYRAFVDEYGSFLHRKMERRQKRQEEGHRRGADYDDGEEEWPNMPPGYRILTPEEQESQRRAEMKVPEEIHDTPTAAHILQDMHTAANDNLLSSFPLESSEDTVGGGDIHESLLSVFDDNSNSPPICPIVIDTVPDDDDILFPGSSC